MRSSGSTRNPPPRDGIPLWIVVVGDDHPRACTGRRLLALGRVAPGPPRARDRAPPIVLDPRAAPPLSPADRAAAQRGGVLVVDCSWNRLAKRGGFPPGRPGSGGLRRRLPLLLAANPQHFGRLAELNTVEAFSAALYVLGEPAASARLLEGFRGGPPFLELNRGRLDRYATAASPAGVAAAERELFGGGPPP